MWCRLNGCGVWSMRVGWGGRGGGQPMTERLTRVLPDSNPRREEEEFGAPCLSGNRCSRKEGSLWLRGGPLKMESCEERDVDQTSTTTLKAIQLTVNYILNWKCTEQEVRRNTDVTAPFREALVC